MNLYILQQREVKNSLCFLRVQLNEAQDEIMKKKELLEDLQPDNTQTCNCRCSLFNKSDFYIDSIDIKNSIT